MGEITYKGLLGSVSEDQYSNLNENGYLKTLIRELVGANNEY